MPPFSEEAQLFLDAIIQDFGIDDFEAGTVFWITNAAQTQRWESWMGTIQALPTSNETVELMFIACGMKLNAAIAYRDGLLEARQAAGDDGEAFWAASTCDVVAHEHEQLEGAQLEEERRQVLPAQVAPYQPEHRRAQGKVAGVQRLQGKEAHTSRIVAVLTHVETSPSLLPGLDDAAVGENVLVDLHLLEALLAVLRGQDDAGARERRKHVEGRGDEVRHSSDGRSMSDLVAAALNMLPPLPDASIVLTSEHGEERFEEVEVYKDILAYGRVIEPGEEAMAGKKVGPEEGEAAGVKKGCWEVALRSVPLVIHDEGLVRAIVDLAPDLGDVSTWVSTAAIRDVLKEHPGPVNCIRVEVSKCPSPKLVRKWMKLIWAKKRGHPLQELVLVNRNRPADEAFHLRLLPDGPGGLRKLSLGFFALKPLDAGHLSLCPAVLRLMGCDLCWQDLSALLLELRALQLLVLVCCHVTSGCGPEGLTIVSSSLTRLEKALCTASGGIRLDYAPRLTILSAGVQPLGTGGQLRLDLRTLGALRELHGLTILLHDLASSLYNVIMDSFRGGAVEVAFATNVLAVACRLGSLLLRPHPKLLLATATEASNSPLICPRASASCQVVFSKLPQI
ncbi:hypothetical protein SETIT_9G178500v2 [Setaria italica]|uniref:FBD domain-containing protein n=1 Tax=Setaria italica TaxID=4555 RepID=A0A368SHT0_SETIT|nr:hypothetical protein SETIT_9G178500v2 [Setaria italica]